MLDGLLPRLEVRLVGPLARFKPGNMLRARDCLCSSAILPILTPGATIPARALIPSRRGRRRRRRRHLDNIGERTRYKGFLRPMATSFPVVLFARPPSAQSRKGFVVVECGGLVLRLVSTPRSRSRSVVSAMVRPEAWRMGPTKTRASAKRRIPVLTRRVKAWKRAVVLDI